MTDGTLYRWGNYMAIPTVVRTDGRVRAAQCSDRHTFIMFADENDVIPALPEVPTPLRHKRRHARQIPVSLTIENEPRAPSLEPHEQGCRFIVLPLSTLLVRLRRPLSEAISDYDMVQWLNVAHGTTRNESAVRTQAPDTVLEITVPDSEGLYRLSYLARKENSKEYERLAETELIEISKFGDERMRLKVLHPRIGGDGQYCVVRLTLSKQAGTRKKYRSNCTYACVCVCVCVYKFSR